jgi:hypothetical protein
VWVRAPAWTNNQAESIYDLNSGYVCCGLVVGCLNLFFYELLHISLSGAVAKKKRPRRDASG